MIIPCLSPESLDLSLRLVIAAALGGLVGLERDIHGRAAGLRTHLLVCTGSALFAIISRLVAQIDGLLVGDPGRIAAQVVTGIGFLGAGAIMREGFTVRGLTTASCLWIVAAIGLAAGSRFFALAGVTTLIALIALTALHHAEKLYHRDSYRTLTITCPNDVAITDIRDLVKQKGVKILFADFDKDYDSGVMKCVLSIRLFHRGSTDKLSHGIVAALEASDIPLKTVAWDHCSPS